MPDIDDFPDHDTLSDFVDLYFEKFHPMFPILHKPTFLESDTPAVLLLSVAAIGATFADLKYRPLAVALCELVRRMIAWMVSDTLWHVIVAHEHDRFVERQRPAGEI